VNGKLFFTAYDGSSGQELWKSDGKEKKRKENHHACRYCSGTCVFISWVLHGFWQNVFSERMTA
jgi:hypothetical protein